MEIICVKEIHKEYKQGRSIVKALDGINLEINRGEFISIVGASGSGKSTLLHIIGGVDIPTSGNVVIDGVDITELKDKDLSVFRRKNIGFIFQSYNLIPVLNVKENILLPIKLNKSMIDEDYINEIIDILGLKERLHHYPNQLSGGQQQRVAIARALANKPKVVLADEPTGNLDSKTGENVLSLLRELNKKYNQTLVMITHDNGIANTADRVLTFKDGLVVS